MALTLRIDDRKFNIKKLILDVTLGVRVSVPGEYDNSPDMVAARAQVPKGWVVGKDYIRDKVYYVNQLTRERRYTMPTCPATFQVP